MEHFYLYHDEMPDFIRECLQAPALLRLQDVGMNCGCEYTSFPRFRGLSQYSRLTHSIGTALITWHFTKVPAQALAALFHDIATPVFAHVVDFLHGDYMAQESTEEGTGALISGSAELRFILRTNGVALEDVTDYHRYSVADNDPPQLSVDRLEYTIGNGINYGILSPEIARDIYGDIMVGINENGEEELMFRSTDKAEAFADAALLCSKIYVSDEDRYSMQMLSELLQKAMEQGVITEEDLFYTEPLVISKLLSDPRTAPLWKVFRSYTGISISETLPVDASVQWRKIKAKKRLINPFVKDAGRISFLSPAFARNLDRFKGIDFNYWVGGTTL